jgi:hypothetical protein
MEMIMDYYVLRQDKRSDNNFIILDFMNQYGEFKDPMICYIEKSGVPLHTDFLTYKPLFDTHYLVRESLMEVIEFYSDAKFKTVVLTDECSKSQELYREISVETIDCVKIEKVMKIENISLYLTKIRNKAVFFIRFEKLKYLVVRTDVLESMLRRYPIGLGFLEVNLIM